MPNSRLTSPTLAPSALALLALLGGCRSERVAFQFQPTEMRTETNDDAGSQFVPAIPPVTYAPLAAGREVGDLEQLESTISGFSRTASATLAPINKRALAARPNSNKKLLQNQRQTIGPAIAKPADPDYGKDVRLFFFLVALLFSVALIGIPFLIAALSGLSFWSALGYWLLVVAGIGVLLLLYSLINAITYSLLSDEKKRERHERRKRSNF